MNEDKTFTSECPVCGVCSTDNLQLFKFSSGHRVSPDTVFTKVCRHLGDTERSKQCINTKGKIDTDLLSRQDAIFNK